MTNTEQLKREAHAVIDAIEEQGFTAGIESLGWVRRPAGFAEKSGVDSYASRGHGKAEWEVVIGHDSGVSYILRSYLDGKRIGRWAVGSYENAGLALATEELNRYNATNA